VLRVEIGIVLGEVASVELRQRTRALDACRSSADHDDMERTVLGQFRVLICRFPLAEDVFLDADRIGQRVHRKRVLWRAFGSEEIHLGAERQHEVVVRDRLHLGELRLALLQVNPCRLVQVHTNVRLVVE
jgi:hypothetical protein